MLIICHWIGDIRNEHDGGGEMTNRGMTRASLPVAGMRRFKNERL